MRKSRLMLVLAPVLLGGCSETANKNEGMGTSSVSAGPTDVPPGSTSTGASTATDGLPTTGVPTPGTTSNGPTTGPTVTPPPSGTAPVPSGTGGTGPTSTGTATNAGTTPAASSPAGSGTTPPVSASGGSAGTSPIGSGTGDGGAGGMGPGNPPPMTCPYTPPEDPDTFPEGWTSGDVTVFNDNGGWTWYNDERVVVDAEAGKLVISSAASNASNQNSNTNIDVVIHDLATGMNAKTAVGSLSYSDDHNNGGIVITAPGDYFVAWAHHNQDCNSYWRNYVDGAWGTAVTRGWAAEGCPWPGPSKPSNVTYNNLWKLSAESGRIYNFVRSVETSPTYLYSDDNGQNWTFGGRLTGSPQQGYNAGYYKYWGNGVDRVDFFATEAHPRDANTSVFHGYMKGGKTYDSFDKEIDADVTDGDAPGITEFTTVFSAGGMLEDVALRRLWNFDIARYADGTIGVLWQGRENECADKNNCDPGHHVGYSRFDGTAWKSTYLVQGGRTLYRESGASAEWWEEDYLGGAALDPDDPQVIYVSTNIDPRDNSTEYPNNEIWKGVTCDEGASFQWSPVTMNSPNENLRPVVPKWDAGNSALLWFRGNYQTAQKYSAEVVGIISTR